MQYWDIVNTNIKEVTVVTLNHFYRFQSSSDFIRDTDNVARNERIK